MSYWMLFTYEGDAWAPQFGDHDHECVRQEREDTYLRQPGYGYADDGKYLAKHIRIVPFPRVPTERQIKERAALIRPPK